VSGAWAVTANFSNTQFNFHANDSAFLGVAMNGAGMVYVVGYQDNIWKFSWNAADTVSTTGRAAGMCSFPYLGKTSVIMKYGTDRTVLDAQLFPYANFWAIKPDGSGSFYVAGCGHTYPSHFFW
jgi:hypothetical protein